MQGGVSTFQICIWRIYEPGNGTAAANFGESKFLFFFIQGTKSGR